jgi:hypothetical protein
MQGSLSSLQLYTEIVKEVTDASLRLITYRLGSVEDVSFYNFTSRRINTGLTSANCPRVNTYLIFVHNLTLRFDTSPLHHSLQLFIHIIVYQCLQSRAKALDPLRHRYAAKSDTPSEPKRKSTIGAEKDPKRQKENLGVKVLRVYVPDIAPLPDGSGTAHKGRLLQKKDRLEVSR